MSAQDIARITADVNYWNEYRDPDPNNYVPLTPQQVQAYYRRQNHVRPGLEALQGAHPQYRPLGPGQPLARPPARELDPIRRQFLDKQIPQLMDDPAEAVHWQGTKFLGQGNFGQVGLWEYNDPDPNGRIPEAGRKVAVKELKLTQNAHRHSLMREAQHLLDLSQGSSHHIVRLMLNPPFEDHIRGSDEDLGPEWDGVVRRIFLEYCPLGSLGDLIERRIRLGVPLTELTLWRMFDCLVDGISALEYLYELRIDLWEDEFFPEKTPKSWVPKVHFDLKPDNVLLADKRTLHATHPTCKIADLGLAQAIKQPQYNTPEWLTEYESMRNIGMVGYLAPEQFTERWDHADWQQSGVAGVYGAATNVWGIGCIMYQLLVMSNFPPNHRDPFYPVYELNGADPKGITYGVDLSMYPYSDSLRDMIQECLYERPSNRPTILHLKRKAHGGVEACIEAGDLPEPWIDFLPAPPLPPEIANPPPLPLLPAQPTRAQKLALRKARKEARLSAKRDEMRQAQPAEMRNRMFTVLCRHFFESGRQCGNKFRTAGTQIYCKDHGG